MLRFGAVRPGWSRMVLQLSSPQVIETADMLTAQGDGTATLKVALRPAAQDAFAAASGAPDDPAWAQLAPLPQAQAARDGAKQTLTVVIDPGHGGIDPGAQGDGIKEADLMLTLARELGEAVERAGPFDVVLTRTEDVFVSLERRVQIARAAGADLFISLHADALASGQANGAAVFTLSREASDAASQALAERHNRADLLAGVDLTGQDDQVARVLMELSRLENAPRSKALARGMGQNGRRHPRRYSGVANNRCSRCGAAPKMTNRPLSAGGQREGRARRREYAHHCRACVLTAAAGARIG